MNKTVKIVLPWSLKNGWYFDKKRWWKVGECSGKAWQRQRGGKVWAIPSPWPRTLPLLLVPFTAGSEESGPSSAPGHQGAQTHCSCPYKPLSISRFLVWWKYNHLSIFSPSFFFVTESYDDPTQQLVQERSLKENYSCGTKREHVLLFARNFHC